MIVWPALDLTIWCKSLKTDICQSGGGSVGTDVVHFGTNTYTLNGAVCVCVHACMCCFVYVYILAKGLMFYNLCTYVL